MDIPLYDKTFSDKTNNLPYPRQSAVLRNRYNSWARGYYPITSSDISIDIEAETSFGGEVVSATAPLLGGTAVASVFGGAGSVVGTGGTVASGILGASAVGLGAYGVKKLVDRTKERGLVLPNSDYIGPLNTVGIGAAKSAGEQAAKDHDLSYADLIEYAKVNALSEKEFSDRVHQLDSEAIASFDKDWKESGSYNSLIGKYGLKVKTLVEKLRGKAIYPG